MTTASPAQSPARFLEQTLLWCFIVHGVAMLTMALVLMSTLPGGPVKDNAQRVASIAENPWLWRLAWVPWHLCAVVDVLLGMALLCSSWIPTLPAVLTMATTICAVIPEQTGELSWVSEGVERAIEAHASGDLGQYLEAEARFFHLAVIVGASIYIVMALGWTWCFVAARLWNRTLTILTPFTWGALAVGGVGLLLPPALRPGDTVLGISNAVGFTLMEIWLILVRRQVQRRSRLDGAHGRIM